MPARRVLPLLVTVRAACAPQDLLDAFLMGEPAELDKIDDWALRFGFETAEPFVIDLMDKPEAETLIDQILENTHRLGAKGVVAAGIEYVRRAEILDGLYERLRNADLELWGANLGSLPVKNLIEV